MLPFLEVWSQELKGDYVFVQTEFQEHREEYHGPLGETAAQAAKRGCNMMKSFVNH